jgi:tetratricopeptide (TPR) repeat protein
MKSKKAVTPTLTPAQAGELRQRLRGLNPTEAEMMQQVMRLHAAGDRLMAGQWLLQLAREAPDHPEVLLWQGLLKVEAGDFAAAVDPLARTAALQPGDFKRWCLLGHAQGQADDGPAALHSLRQAAACARTPAEWMKLSVECDLQGFYEEALAAAEAVVKQEPASVPGRLQRARCHKALGHSAAAAEDFRRLIDADREVARAWFGLLDLKTVNLQPGELERLSQHAQRPGRPVAEQQMIDFALGKALEDVGDRAAALAVFQRANGSVRQGQPWDAAAFARHMGELHQVFETGPDARAQPQGEEIIFLVGMPRSGSTLVEQVLASHSQVEGASELPYLQQVIEAESRRRGQAFPMWVNRADPDDWTRLGQEYLRMSARWRTSRPKATDKMPDNWRLVGAVCAMLPQARVIDCRRDPLETAWSCYKQLFGPGLANFSYDFDSLGQYGHACEALGDLFARRFPLQVRVQSYEALVAEPEAQIRELLDFCGLPFEAGCLSFHTAQRAIRTPSALQVRQPMTRTSTPAGGYGALLDPLRAALAADRRPGRPGTSTAPA